jgi:hypothetical protein
LEMLHDPLIFLMAILFFVCEEPFEILNLGDNINNDN